MLLRTIRIALFGAATLVAVPSTLLAQDLPAAGQLIDRYVEAMGGEEAVMERFTARAAGEFSMPAAGMSGRLEVYTAPSRMLTIVELPGLGTMRSGFDGTVGWSVDPIQGARVLSEVELNEMREQVDPRYTVRDASLFTSRETVEQTQIRGTPCYRVRLVSVHGRESFDCYAIDSGLLVATTAETETPMGRIEATTIMEDYREHNGVRMPMRITTEVMGMEQVMSITEIEFDDVDPEVFELPEEIRALVGQ